jgi:hypothetical protein
MHIYESKHAAEGVAKCFHSVQSLKDAPSLILFGGDHVMDTMANDDAESARQCKLWHDVVKNELSIPYESCIGNHDVFGWNKPKSGCTGLEANYGKKRALDELGLAQRYRSFDHSGWHFIVLDSIYPKGNTYKGLTDDEQFAWLESDLKSTPAAIPVLILSHIPLMSMTTFIDNPLKADDSYVISSKEMHGDWLKYRDLFKQYPNVKVALSGHEHLLDRVDYNGVTYLCGGAVCGSWWKGPNGEGDCNEGYGILDLYDDGSIEHEYISYGWTAQP